MTWQEECFTVLQLKPGMTVADFGAGRGAWCKYLTDRLGPTSPIYAVERGIYETTQIADGILDAMSLMSAIKVWHGPTSPLEEAHRCLKAGGRCLILEQDYRGGDLDDVVKANGLTIVQQDASWSAPGRPEHLLILAEN